MSDGPAIFPFHLVGRQVYKELPARLRAAGKSVGPACSVFLAYEDGPILTGRDLTAAADMIEHLSAAVTALSTPLMSRAEYDARYLGPDSLLARAEKAGAQRDALAAAIDQHRDDTYRNPDRNADLYAARDAMEDDQ